MLTIIIVIIALSLLILAHEAGHFIAAKFFGLRVDEFGIGFPPRLFAKKKGETEYSVNALPFGGFVRIAGENDRPNEESGTLDTLPEAERRRYFAFQSAWKRSVIVLAGVAVNAVLAWLLIAFVYMIGTPPIVLVSTVVADSPAASAGLVTGDIVHGYTKSSEFIEFVNSHKGAEITFEVQRGKDLVAITTTPRSDPPAGQGALGVGLVEGGIERQDPFSALIDGAKQTGHLAWATVGGFYTLIKTAVTTGNVSRDVVGPVGIVVISRDVGEIGALYLVQLLGLISINLAVLNLIPFPALDGGRFIMILLEKLKGSPISRRVEAYVNGIGFVLLLLLMVIVTFRDVAKLL